MAIKSSDKKILAAANRSLIKRLVFILIAGIFFGLYNTPVLALDPEQKRIIQSGAYYFNYEQEDCSTVTPFAGSSGGGIYVLGDSLTVGMRDSGELSVKLVESGWQPTKINAVGGRMLNWGLEQVSADRDIITNSDSVLIGLGTNNIGDVVEGSNALEGGKERVKATMQLIIDQAKDAKANIRIYWTSVYITGSLTTEFGTFNLDVARPIINEAINEIALENGVAVLPWGDSSEAREYISSDGIHPSSRYPQMADYIVGQLGNTGATAAPSRGCVCTPGATELTGSDNQQRAFNFFVSKGYTAEWSAGIVGNMISESGVEPMRLQNTASGVETSSSSLGNRLNNSNLGWGLVQWTPPGKMITPSIANGVSHSEIDSMEYQLDFVWKQLEGTAIAINERAAGDKLKETTTPEDAAFAFGRYYERFENASDTSNPETIRRYNERREAARSVFDIYSGSAPILGGNTTRCGSGTAGVNGWDLPGEGLNPMVYYSQRREGSDPAVQGYYGNDPYGPGPISFCGCGPTSWAMMVNTLTTRSTTPTEVAAWASSNGWQQPSRDGAPCGGSSWWWDGNAQRSEQQWGVRAQRLDDIDDARTAIRAGALVMMSSNSRNTGVESPFTAGGHLLVIRAVTDDGRFLFADPNDYNDTRAVAQAVFGGQSKSRTPLSPEQFMPSTQGLWAVTSLE